MFIEQLETAMVAQATTAAQAVTAAMVAQVAMVARATIVVGATHPCRPTLRTPCTQPLPLRQP